jgi:signal transduction histidine kinase
MKWFNQSLFIRLIVSILTTVLLGFGIIGVVISFSTKDYITDQKKQDMLRQAKSVNGAILDHKTVNDDVIDTLDLLGEVTESNIWLFDKNGNVVGTSIEQEVFSQSVGGDLVQKVLGGQSIIQLMEVDEAERPMLSIVVPWGEKDDVHGGIILQSPVSGIKSTIQNIREIVLWAIIIGLIIVGVLVAYLSWTISKPLRRIERAATEIALGNYGKRVEYHSTDEIGEVVKSFNRMAEKLDEMEKKRDALEHRRSEFIANISHELRTPLTAMQGFLEALQDGLVTDEASQRKYYEIMYGETQYLNHLVNDLMDLIKLENNEVSLDFYYVQVDEIIKKAALTLEQEIAERGNEVELDLPEMLPPILGDAIRLEQIFINLINNANKFTEDGKIKLNAIPAEKVLIVKISDTGMGIPSHDLKRIWDRFFKVDRGRSKKGRGTGLGLAIVKELVKLHHAEIHADSKLGKGTSFTIHFPLVNDQHVRLDSERSNE